MQSETNKKYEFTGQTKVVFGLMLNQIVALKSFGDVKKGDVGGWIQKEDNLSQFGNAWVFGNARVFGNALVFGHARVSGDALVYGDARVYGDALVYGDARVFGDALVFGDAWVYGDALVYGNARVYGDAILTKKVINIIGVDYNVTISDNYMAVGCENHPINEWLEFKKNDIIEMDGKDALVFYKIWKKPLKKILKSKLKQGN